jgi:hypothetical protein
MTPLIDSELLVHIGLHKTASSWLQQRLFSLPDRGFYGPAEAEKWGSQRVKNVGHRLLFDETRHLLTEWEFDAEAARRDLGALMTKPGLCPVLSNERLGGHPLSGGFDRRVISNRIKAVFPKARVLICIREQGAIILSNYMQYLRNGGWNTPEAFLAPKPDGRQPALTLKFWEYDSLASLYYAAFGRDRVLILPYELFASDLAGFAKRICDFVGLPAPRDLPGDEIVNLRRGHVSSYYSRFLTPLRKSSSENGYFPASRAGRFIDKWVKGAIDAAVPRQWEEKTRLHLEHRIETYVGDHYRESNRRMQRLTGLDLAGLGYRV